MVRLFYNLLSQMKKICLHIFIFLFLFSPSILPQDSIRILKFDYVEKKLPFGLTKKIPAQKPVVGLALSGGGARGLAQIGVLKVFDEYNIPIDLIVGTSMGSIVGGLYSSGYEVDELDSIAKTIAWEDLLTVGKKTDRRSLFVDQKISEDKAVFTLRLDGFKPVLPTSINDGQKFANYLNLLVLQAPTKVEDSFDDIEIKFRAVSTNLETGEPAIISRGSLSQAMRASSSVTFFLTPVKIDSLLLVDGGLVANIPAKITKELGAEFVVAVNTTSQLNNREQLELPWFVADQIVSIPMRLLNENQLQYADFVIEPEFQNQISTDFTEIDSIILIGYNEAKKNIKYLKHQLDSIFISRLQENNFYLNNIAIDTAKNIGREFLKKYLTKDSVASSEILFDLHKINQEGYFNNLRAVIINRNGNNFISFDYDEPFLIKEIEVENITLLAEVEIQNIFQNLEGTPYSGEKVLSAIKKLLLQYRKNGFSLAELKEVKFDEASGVLRLRINEGKIDSIIILGNHVTNATVIYRELPISVGDLFLYENVQQGMTNLRSTNLFENVNIDIEEINGTNLLVIEVQEKTTNVARFGFKIDNESRAQLSVDVRDENIFGTGTELGLMFFISNKERSTVFEHKANRVFNTYLTFNFNAYYKLIDALSYRYEPTFNPKTFNRISFGEYRQIYYGASFSLGTQVRRLGNLIFTGRYEINEVKNLHQATVDPYNITILSLRASSTIDTQDKYPYPTTGLRFNVYYETAQELLGSKIGFSNLGLEYKGYFTLAKSHTFSSSLKLGFADKTLPLSKQYSLGGQNSFFGMRQDEYRGRQIFVTSYEYQYHLPVKIFFDTYLMIRYDLGSMWNVQEAIRFKDLKHGVGATLSFDTPIGPADFSVGRSFLLLRNPNETIINYGPINFYFSIGYYY